MKEENKMQREIIDYCHINKIFVIKTNGEGLPDLILCYRGYFVACELKAPGEQNQVTKIQWIRIREILKSGGIATIISSLHSFVFFLERIMDGITYSDTEAKYAAIQMMEIQMCDKEEIKKCKEIIND
jgi:hypothetical protein